MDFLAGALEAGASVGREEEGKKGQLNSSGGRREVTARARERKSRDVLEAGALAAGALEAVVEAGLGAIVKE